MCSIVKQNEFYKVFKENGYRLTTQRKIVLDILIEYKEEHLSIKEIFDKVKEIYPHIGMATVYRTILLFEKVGIVQSIFLNNDYMRYQLKNPQEKHFHHHVVCEYCGAVFDIQDDLLELLEEQVFIQKGFTVTNHKVVLIGICKECSESLRSQN